MTTELRFLIGSVILGLVHLITSSHLISWQRGYRWTASNREEEAPPLHGLPNRVDQATTNFLETFPFFAALVLIAAGYQSPWFPYCLRRSVVFLGTGGLSTGSGRWIQLGALGSFLECSRHRYVALFDSNFIAWGLIAINHSFRSTLRNNMEQR